MHLVKRYNEIMGPKDERLEAAEGRAMKVTAYILLAGAVISLYYMIMLDQVASTTDHPIMTNLGESVISPELLLIITILAACIASLVLQVRSGFFSSYTRFAEVDKIPWDYVGTVALVCGTIVGALACGMRIIAEIQIVGIDQVAWLGDLAIGVVYFVLGFFGGFIFFALSVRDAIKRRHKIERELEG